jgi:hypothetical protein
MRTPTESRLLPVAGRAWTGLGFDRLRCWYEGIAATVSGID